ncbi:MAG: 50S ribosomal protein L27 [Candidatus Terrybacteria bacterium RIFCSPLOWO2_01_FULL_44_24]|uniref:Large ribosomal subunit protein bL27 n=1 Tax=Candidatus Terrybacteria bacterium RIFCSPHIGHO2_01_FULL_43_35 TaxID=1802361 RepID=A0A1G2PE46_9BACT|nr:MAG: 50S ribosomal protein L27 [Candidatus Terrybacteria bacterium RIFCSPHIGHO2_01_FULL_43_35]OHA49658.1 MAG: 50S ribosomal protein L27 [Candidatus Terrybacteria bacterium RIFCSPHIGHO2_02_FULL_43_14]OHA51323.1 MAG: 50S ribosomal protein L27 [Candidatus Terrybacteria bacterium RIFCSPLOWO2_01_FULL_44_24]
MSKTKASGSTKLGRDSISKRLGVKLFAGERAKAGSILIRQRGTKFLPGENVKRAADDTLFSLTVGIVKFRAIKKKRFDGRSRISNIVSVVEEK